MQKSLANQIKGVCQALLQEIVPRTGVEPVISALKGRRPWPLDERGLYMAVRYVAVNILTLGLYPIAYALSSKIFQARGHL